MKSRWRQYAAPIIQKVLNENIGKTDAEKRAALREAYPFGEREYHPYKIWCDEVKRQMGTKPTKLPKDENQLNLL
jgi:hypothetical protein